MIINSNVYSELKKNGATIVSFLEREELTALRNFYEQLTDKYPLGFSNSMHMTTFSSDYQYKIHVKSSLENLLKNPSERLFEKYRALNSIFIVKQAGTEQFFNMHSDWSIVDESLYESYNVWIPLYDTSIENGALWVVKGSHLLNTSIRGGGSLLHMYNYTYDEVKDIITVMEVKAGEAIIFNLNTIHGSFPNNSKQHRPISSFTVVPNIAPLRICFQKNSEESVLFIEPEDDFMYKYSNILEDSNKIPPVGKLVGVNEKLNILMPSLYEIRNCVNQK